MNSYNSIKKNSTLVVLSYWISVSLTQTFLFGLLFYNRLSAVNSTYSWAILYSSFLLPGALVNTPIGIITDIFNKKRMMLLSEMFSAIISIIFLLMFLNGFNTLPYLCIYLATFSVAFSFFEIPLDASSAIIAKDNADSLISFVWISRALSHLIGPILGRALSYHPKYLFILNTASFIISAFLQYLMKYENNYHAVSDLKIFKRVKEEISGVKNYIKQNNIILLLLALNLVLAMFYLPIFGAIMPAMTRSLALGETTLSYVESSNWLGVIIGSAIIITTRSSGFFLKNLFKTLAIQGGVIFTWTLVDRFFYKNQLSSILVILSIIDGLLLTLQNLGALTYFQMRIPENMRGKILGAMRTVMKLSAPLGITIYGILLEKVSWQTMISVTATTMVLAGLIIGNTKIIKTFKKSINN
jgi:predicted MFS family arabinose efflux permease